MVARLNSICFFDFHSGPSGPFLAVQSGRRLVVSRLRGRAVERASLTHLSLGRFRFCIMLQAGVGVPARYRVGRFV